MDCPFVCSKKSDTVVSQTNAAILAINVGNERWSVVGGWKVAAGVSLMVRVPVWDPDVTWQVGRRTSRRPVVVDNCRVGLFSSGDAKKL
jgi:hypothetical protein